MSAYERALRSDVSDARRDERGRAEEEVTGRHTWADPDPTRALPVADGPPTQPMPVVDASATQAMPMGDASATQAMTVVADPTPVGGMPIPRRRRSRWGRRIVVGLLALVLIGGAYFGITLYQVHSTGQSDQARTVDAIVVMGAAQYNTTGPSAQLAARLDHVVTLWQRGLASTVVTTGGNQPGDRFTEAEASKTYLVDRGVPGDSIVLENTSRNTYDAFRGVAELLPRGSSVLIVTDPFHALRSRLTAQEHGFDAYVSPTPTSVVVGNTARNKELKEAAGVALGRIIGFRRLLGITG